MLLRPKRDECAEYYHLYIDQVPDGDVLVMLTEQLRTTPAFLRDLPTSKHAFRYAVGKWSIKELVGHLIDVERTFAHRAFCIARREPAELPSFDQEPYVEHSSYQERLLEDIVSEYEAVRPATVALFRSFRDDDWECRGVASGCEFTVRTFPYIIVGHEIHHRRVIVDRYLR